MAKRSWQRGKDRLRIFIRSAELRAPYRAAKELKHINEAGCLLIHTGAYNSIKHSKNIRIMI